MKIKKDTLVRMIRESITKCLNEAEGYVWYGDKSLVQAVANDANQVRLMAEDKMTDEPDTNIYHELHNWANKVMSEADEFLQYHSDNVSIMSEAHDIDADTYYGGGLPEPAQHAMTYTPEKEVAEICEQMRPYVDKLADVFNSYSPTVQGVDDKVFTLLNGFDELPKLAKFFSTTEID